MTAATALEDGMNCGKRDYRVNYCHRKKRESVMLAFFTVVS